MKDEFIKKINGYRMQLKAAIKRHYPELVAQQGKVYAYSLYSCDDASHIFPVANRECDVKDEEFRYQPDEYELWDETDYFKEASASMGNIMSFYDSCYENDYDRQQEEFPALMEAMEDGSDITYSCWEDSRDFLFLAALQVLNELKKEGFFDDDMYLVVWPSDTSSTIIEKSTRVLNKPEVIEKCRQFFNE